MIDKFALLTCVVLTSSTAFGQMFAHCWDDSGKKIDGSDAKALVNLMIRTGIPGNHRPQGDDWTVALNCQNVWVMPGYSRMYYLCSMQHSERYYSFSESDSASVVNILESHGFLSEMNGEITKWQVKQLSCGTSYWTRSMMTTSSGGSAQ